ncbi:tetratricopeptide repeat protein [Roseibacterium sp. SDUM158017]|uniref:tetratricopeptide repeat protein n=1 Tax=Roseicyclus salinarum TaxID=3036773 RepID=UPI0024155476|nr:tetratricopeptide repeat protein [Roseibacterium sp. SDUM158017]MDG4650581.1 tetratricopeptide repeat protein [Roseibacterium sp. SDUM158017]
MLELGQPQTNAAAAGDLIKDGTEATFMADVIEGSREVPVIVDFWATWCGPCKTLGPMLEAAVMAAKGKVRLIKIDVDREQRLAGALAQQGLPLQSIPTVVAFHDGQPVDMFQGALPQGQVNDFVNKLISMAGDGGLSEAIEAAEQMLAEGATADAAQTFAAILGEVPDHAGALGGLARAHVAMGQLDQAEALLNNAPEKIATAPELEAARAQIALARQAENAGPLAELAAAVEADPSNLQARFDHAQALHASGHVEEAVEQLLELFRRDREWNDGAAKAQLFTIFDALKPTDPIAQKGRRRLSSMIFA